MRRPPVADARYPGFAPIIGACAAALVLGVGACGPAADPGPETRAPLHADRAAAQPRAVERPGVLRALREIKLHNEEEGRVREVAAGEGDAVQAGAVLARLDDSLLRAQLDAVVARRRQAEVENERLHKLAEKGLLTRAAATRGEAVLQSARAEERLLAVRLSYLSIAAPFAGVVAERHVQPGDMLARHTQLFTLVDASELLVSVTVPERVLPRLRAGETVEVRIDALGAAHFPARIRRIHPTVDPGTRLGRVEVALESVPPGAAVGQACVVRFAAATEQP